MATLFLFVSCKQYDTPEVESINKFDDTILNHFKDNISTFHSTMKEVKEIKEKWKNKTSSTNLIEVQNSIVSKINKYYKTNLEVEGNILELVNLNSDDILYSSFNNGWINKKDAELTNLLIANIELKGFDMAIKKYTEDVLKLALPNDQFSKKNIFVNTLKFINHQNPDYFKFPSQGNLQKSLGWGWGCAKATIALAGTSIGLSACATVALCILAVACFAIAADNFADKCVGAYLENNQ